MKILIILTISILQSWNTFGLPVKQPRQFIYQDGHPSVRLYPVFFDRHQKTKGDGLVVKISRDEMTQIFNPNNIESEATKPRDNFEAMKPRDHSEAMKPRDHSQTTATTPTTTTTTTPHTILTSFPVTSGFIVSSTPDLNLVPVTVAESDIELTTMSNIDVTTMMPEEFETEMPDGLEAMHDNEMVMMTTLNPDEELTTLLSTNI